MPKILIIGANGQLGSELATALADKYGAAQVITSDIAPAKSSGLKHEILDATDAEALRHIVTENNVTQVYHLAAALSATLPGKPELPDPAADRNPGHRVARHEIDQCWLFCL